MARWKPVKLTWGKRMEPSERVDHYRKQTGSSVHLTPRQSRRYYKKFNRFEKFEREA